MANEKLQYEIAALYSGQPAIKQAFEDFGKLNAAGAKVARELQNLANASKTTGNAIRENRHATAQLGMQFNQFGTQIASGTSPLLAFQQQLGDVGYALSGMEGPLGKVGRFLAGPWGVAIMVAATALTPYIAKLFETSDALEKMGKAAEDAMVKLRASLNTGSLFQDAMDKNQKVVVNTLGEIAKVNRDIKAQEAIVQGLGANAFTAGANAQAIAGAHSQIATLKARREELNKNIAAAKANIQETFSLAKVQSMQAEAQARLTELGKKDKDASKDKTKKHVQEIDVLLERQKEVVAAYNAGSMTYSEYLTKLNEVTDAYKRSGESAKDMIRLQLQAFESLQRIKQSGKMVIDDMTVTDLGKIVADNVKLDIYDAFAEKIKARNEEIRNSFQAIGASVSDAFKGMLTAGMSWRDGMKGIINSVIDELWRMFVVKQITGFVTKTLGSAFGLPGFANGTMNAPGGMALVGERGPEIVNLPRGSQVIPAHRSKGMMGGGVTVNVDARGSADPAAVRAQVQQGILEAAPSIIAAAQQRTVGNLRRPRLGGAMQ